MGLIKNKKRDFINRILSLYDTSNDPLWDYEVIDARINTKRLLRHDSVQCYLGANYVLYELKDSVLTYKIRKNFSEKYGEPIGQVELPKRFRELNLIFVMLIHKKLVQSKYGL